MLNIKGDYQYLFYKQIITLIIHLLKEIIRYFIKTKQTDVIEYTIFYLMKKENQSSLPQHLLIYSKYAVPVYRWNQTSQKWSPVDLDEQYDIETNIKQQKELSSVTLNVLFDKRNPSDSTGQRPNIIYSQERYRFILQELGKQLPDFITLQEVTATFIRMMQDCLWLREHYYISEIYEVNIKDPKYSLGNLLLTKIKPVAMHSIQVHRLPRRIIIGFFRIKLNHQTKYFSLSSVHLTAFNWNFDRRTAQLTEIVQYLHKFDHLVAQHFLQGDMNFHSEEENSLSQKLNLRDCWQELNNLNNNQGFTFDSRRNLMVDEIYWGFERRRMRLDRIFHFGKPLLKIDDMKLCFDKPIYCEPSETEGMNRIKGAFAFLFDRFGVSLFRTKQNYLFPSDHFGIKIKLKCQ